MKELLFANISGETVHVPSILALAVLGLASDDADLLDAAQSELESLLSSGVASVDSGVRLLVAVKTLTGSQGGVDALTLVHDTIQATIGRRIGIRDRFSTCIWRTWNTHYTSSNKERSWKRSRRVRCWRMPG